MGPPAELRNRIYAYAATEERAVVIYSQPSRVRKGITPLAHVNQQVRSETLAIYYSSKTFRPLNLGDLQKWLRMIGPMCKWVRHIELPENLMPRVCAMTYPRRRSDFDNPRSKEPVGYVARIEGSKLIEFEMSVWVPPVVEERAKKPLYRLATSLGWLEEAVRDLKITGQFPRR